MSTWEFQIGDIGIGYGGRDVAGARVESGEGEYYHHNAYTQVLQLSGGETFGGGGDGGFLVVQMKTLSGVYSTFVELIQEGGLEGRYSVYVYVCICVCVCQCTRVRARMCV